MKIKLTLKDPDGVYESLQLAVDDAVDADDARIAQLPDPQAAAEALREEVGEQVQRAAARWVQWGEYVSIEIDTVAGTAVVLPAEAS